MLVKMRASDELIFVLLFSPGSVLHALKERYQLREPYTYSGIVLVSDMTKARSTATACD